MSYQDASTQVMQAISERLGLDPAELDLKIQYGKNGRIILGKLASGEQRNELSEDKAGIILAALKESPTETILTSAYVGKKPLLEICNGHTVLLRQERDGAISANTLFREQSLNLTQTPVESDVWAVQVSTLPGQTPVNAENEQFESHPAVQIAQVAEQLVNPLAEPFLVAEAMIGDYHIDANGDDLTIARDDKVLIQVAGGEVFADPQLTQKDAQTFQGWTKELDGTWQIRELPVEDMSQFMWQTRSNSLQVANTLIQASSDATSASHVVSEPPAIAIAKRLIDQLPKGVEQQFFQHLVEDIGKQAVQAVQSIQHGLDSDSFKTFQRNTGYTVQEGANKAMELAGRGLEAAGQWLASRPEAIREQRTARTAYALFEKGFARTQEKRYEHQGFCVELRGHNNFTLSDAETGRELLRFKAEKTLFGEPKFTVLDKSAVGISRQEYRAIDEMRQDVNAVRGSVQAEITHAQKSEVFASAARIIAEFNQTQDYQGKHYRIQAEQDSLTIFALDGRGLLYSRSENEVISNLEQKDFGRFSQAMQWVEHHTNQQSDGHRNHAEIG
jgi:hypothetical protein